MSIYTLNEIELFVKKCNQCSLYKTRTKTVFGESNTNANIIFVSEAPGFNEDKTGRLFIGKSGKLLDKMLKSINLSIEFLRWQVKIVEPSIIACLGAVAAKNIIKKDFKLYKERGIWFKKGKYFIIATYHPGALLRDESKKNGSLGRS